MANQNIEVEVLHPRGGSSDPNRYITGYKNGITKNAQNDTLTVTNAATIELVDLQVGESHEHETYTVDGNVITMTSANTGVIKCKILFTATLS